MRTLKIASYPDPVLRRKAKAVEKVDSEITTLAKQMLRTMREEHGIGLAGNQVGEARRLVVIDSLPEALANPLFMVNPAIEQAEGRVAEDEGCLSFPGGVFGMVPRHRKVLLTFQDLEGGSVRMEVEGVLARVVQHELDHLDGILFPDRLSFFARQVLLRRYRRKQRG